MATVAACTLRREVCRPKGGASATKIPQVALATALVFSRSVTCSQLPLFLPCSNERRKSERLKTRARQGPARGHTLIGARAAASLACEHRPSRAATRCHGTVSVGQSQKEQPLACGRTYKFPLCRYRRPKFGNPRSRAVSSPYGPAGALVATLCDAFGVELSPSPCASHLTEHGFAEDTSDHSCASGRPGHLALDLGQADNARAGVLAVLALWALFPNPSFDLVRDALNTTVPTSVQGDCRLPPYFDAFALVRMRPRNV